MNLEVGRPREDGEHERNLLRGECNFIVNLSLSGGKQWSHFRAIYLCHLDLYTLCYAPLLLMSKEVTLTSLWQECRAYRSNVREKKKRKLDRTKQRVGYVKFPFFSLACHFLYTSMMIEIFKEPLTSLNFCQNDSVTRKKMRK